MMRYLKMTLPAIILVVVLIVALRLYPDMAKSYQERESAAAEAQTSEETNVDSAAQQVKDTSADFAVQQVEETSANAETQPEDEDPADEEQMAEENSTAEHSGSKETVAEAEQTESSSTAARSENIKEDTAASKSASANTAPDFELKDEAGVDCSLSDHFGKPIVVNFWATWCPYCVQELPLFEKYYQQYSDEIDFMIVDLADGYRETIAMAKEYAAGNGYSFPVYFDTTGGSMYAYGITGIPVTLFIDSDGNLVTQHVGAIDEDTLVRNIKSLGIDVQQ